MNIKIKQTISTSLGVLEEGKTYDVEPGFAEGLVRGSVAKVEGSSETPVFPSTFPGKEHLYAAGIKDPWLLNPDELDSIPGLEESQITQIRKGLLPAATNDLPAEAPFRDELFANGINSGEALMNVTAEQLQKFLSTEQMEQVSIFMDSLMSGGTKEPSKAIDPNANGSEKGQAAKPKKRSKKDDTAV